jgi:uncharacterized membrane protein
MPNLAPLLPYLLVVHVSLAVALFVPSLLLPFTLRQRAARLGPASGEARPAVRLLRWAARRGSLAIGAGLAVTGAAMLAAVGPAMLTQPWLLVSLATYVGAAAVSLAVQGPGLRQLEAAEASSEDIDREAWRARARRQRYVAYGITTAVGLIAFLMSTKPRLW